MDGIDPLAILLQVSGFQKCAYKGIRLFDRPVHSLSDVSRGKAG